MYILYVMKEVLDYWCFF